MSLELGLRDVQPLAVAIAATPGQVAEILSSIGNSFYCCLGVV